MSESGLRERLQGYGVRRSRRDDWETEEDDWLAEAGDLDWREPGPRHRREGAGRAEPPGGPRPDQLRLPGTVVQRRRAAALLALLVLAGAIALAVALLRGGGGTPAPTVPTTTEAATTQPPAATVPAPTPAPALTLAKGETLKQGDTGAKVKRLQQVLARLGYDPGTADGDFGTRTGAAVAAFQKAHGLDADGVVGAKTAAKLDAAVAAAG